MAVITIREKQPTAEGFAASLIFEGGEYPINITEHDVGYRTIARPLIEVIQNSQLPVNIDYHLLPLCSLRLCS